MKVHVLIFGQLADITGSGALEIENVGDTDTLINKLNGLYPDLVKSSYILAVNEQIIQGNESLKNGGTVALLPPFSGG